MSLSSERRRYLIFQQAIPSAIINFFLNAGIAWLVVRRLPAVPLWGETSIGGDTLVTAFVLPFLVCLIVSPLVKREVAAGKIPALSSAENSNSFWAARSTFIRSLALGIICVPVIAGPVVGILSALGVSEFSRWGFIGFKASFAAGLSAIVAPISAWWALAKASKVGASA